MEFSRPTGCLILACGNPLRGDDGVGLWLAAWAEERFRDEPGVRVIACQQWGPELAEEVALAQLVLFLDLSLESAAGAIEIAQVAPGQQRAGLSTHHLNPSELLGLTKELYTSLPRHSVLLTVGAGSAELREGLSAAVSAALPEACARIEEIVEKKTQEP